MKIFFSKRMADTYLVIADDDLDNATFSRVWEFATTHRTNLHAPSDRKFDRKLLENCLDVSVETLLALLFYRQWILEQNSDVACRNIQRAAFFGNTWHVKIYLFFCGNILAEQEEFFVRWAERTRNGQSHSPGTPKVWCELSRRLICSYINDSSRAIIEEKDWARLLFPEIFAMDKHSRMELLRDTKRSAETEISASLFKLTKCTIISVCISIFPTGLLPYVVLEIVDWLPNYHLVPHWHKITLIQNCFESMRKMKNAED